MNTSTFYLDGTVEALTNVSNTVPEKKLGLVRFNEEWYGGVQNDMLIPVIVDGVKTYRVHLSANAMKGRARKEGFDALVEVLVNAGATVTPESAFMLRQGSMPGESKSIKNLDEVDFNHPQIDLYGAMSNGLKDYGSSLVVDHAFSDKPVNVERKTTTRNRPFYDIHDPTGVITLDPYTRQNPTTEGSFREVIDPSADISKFLPNVKTASKERAKAEKDEGGDYKDDAPTNQMIISEMMATRGSMFDHEMKIRKFTKLKLGWLLMCLFRARTEPFGGGVTLGRGMIRVSYVGKLVDRNGKPIHEAAEPIILDERTTEDEFLDMIRGDELYSEAWTEMKAYLEVLRNDPSSLDIVSA